MLKPYAPKAQVIWSTPHPANVVALAAQQTMKKNPEIKGNPSALLSFLISADHLNPVEHAVICFRITDVSRACFDQHVRHRIASYTSSSQHYQDYTSYDCFVHPYMVNDERVQKAHAEAVNAYALLMQDGEAKEEARMLLPMSAGVNVVVTMNARSLINFLQLRLCRRNVQEMQMLATAMHSMCCDWFPELFSMIGPYCFMHNGRCNQGKMSCGSPVTSIISK